MASLQVSKRMLGADLPRLLAYLSIIGTLGGAIISLIALSGDSFTAREKKKAEQFYRLQVAVVQLQEALIKEKTAQDQVRQRTLRELQKDPNAEALRGSLLELSRNEDQLSERMSRLEIALGDSPEKAVAIPLLRQQIADTQDRTRGDLEALRAEFARVYTTMQWLLGVIIALILALAGYVLKRPQDCGVKT